MVLEVDKSPKVMAGSDEGGIVGQGYLSTYLALGRRGLVDEQMQVVVDHGVFCFQPGGCRGCWLMIQSVRLNH